MKKLLTLFLLFSFFFAHSQEDTSKYQKYPTAYGPQYKDLWATRVLRLPDTTGHRPMLGAPGALGRNTAGTQVFIWDGSAWQGASGGGVTVDSVFITSIDSIFITNTDSIFIVSGNDTIFIGTGNGIRDTAALTFNWGFIASENPYKPNGLNMSVTLDSAALQNFIDSINASDTTIGQVINNASFIVKYHTNAPVGGDAEGDQYLVGTTPTGAFTGHANEIATKVGATYTFETATSGDNLIVNNAATHVFLSYRFNGSTWNLVNIVVIAGGNSGVGDLPIGTYDSHNVSLITKNLPAITIDTNQNVSINKFRGVRSNNYSTYDSATGNLDTGFFKRLVAGTNITISSGATADTISATASSGASRVYASTGLANVNDSTLRLDTSYTDLRYLPDGLITPGYVTWSGNGLTFDVTSAIYTINGVRYTSAAGSVTLTTADVTNPRYDVIAVDNTGTIVAITGTAASNPTIPQVDPATQVYLTAILVTAGATTPTDITQTIIYDEVTAEAYSGTSVGVSSNFSNTTSPFHGTKSADIGSWTAGQTVTFTKNTGTALATDYTVLKAYILLKAALSSTANIRVSFLNGTTVVSNVITLAGKYGFTKSNHSSYQNISIPISAFTFSSTTFNKVRFTLAGTGGGAYIDYVQFQGGIVTTIPAEVDPFSVHVVDTAAMLSPYLRTNIAAATYRTQSQVRSDISLTTTGTSGAATYNNSTGVLNVPQYSGGSSSVVFDSLTWISAKDWGILPTNSEATNTIAATAAIAYLITRGGGTLYFPYADSAYKVQIVIPAIAPSVIFPIRIIGASPPAFSFGTVGTLTLPTKGVILKSAATSGAIISATAYGGGFSYLTLYVENLELRSYPNPQINGIDAANASQLITNNVFINTNIYNVQAIMPSNASTGIITPLINNGAVTVINNTAVTGYKIGIDCNEHTSGTDNNVFSCWKALNINAANHDISFRRIDLSNNHYNIYGAGTASVNIQANIEHAALTDSVAWQNTVYDVNDSLNRIHGIAFWKSVPTVSFTKNGGTSFYTYNIDSTDFARIRRDNTFSGNNVFSNSLGINTTTPNFVLSASLAPATILNAYDGTNLAALVAQGHGAGVLYLVDNNAGSNLKVTQINSTAGKTYFRTLNDALATTFSPITVDNSNGFVGMNKTSPAVQLDVVGLASFSGSASLQNITNTSTTASGSTTFSSVNSSGNVANLSVYGSTFSVVSLRSKAAIGTDASLVLSGGGGSASGAATSISFRPDGYDAGAERAIMDKNAFTFKESVIYPYVAKTAIYTITAADHTINCTSGTFTVTLPTAVSITGTQYTIVNSGSGTITIGTTSSQTFTNITSTPTTLTLGAVGSAGAIVSYTLESNWCRIG
jgi:hypothetical protein